MSAGDRFVTHSLGSLSGPGVREVREEERVREREMEDGAGKVKLETKNPWTGRKDRGQEGLVAREGKGEFGRRLKREGREIKGERKRESEGSKKKRMWK